jgi:hypothetical protein
VVELIQRPGQQCKKFRRFRHHQRIAERGQDPRRRALQRNDLLQTIRA